jgi:tRNA threonylcarbamoyladenosine biosynthesis protein TsaE
LGVIQPVTSPTFTLINEYPGRLPLFHIDLYRIRSADEALALGLDEYFEAPGVTAIEWPERIGDLLPESALRVALVTGSNQSCRVIHVRGSHALIAKLPG